MNWRSFVALGDSFTAGSGDPVPGVATLSWAERLARAIRAAGGDLAFHNLARHGLRTAQIRAEQLPQALALRPDLASVIAGANDVFAPGWDPARFREDYAAIVGALAATGATVITSELADFTAIADSARPRHRLRERLEAANAIIHAVGDEHNTICVAFWHRPRTLDRAAWSADRIHPNMLGYRWIAEDIAAALAARCGLPLRIEE